MSASALIYFTKITPHIGGSEWLVLSLISELQKIYDVTLAFSSEEYALPDLTKYGLNIDLGKVQVVFLLNKPSMAQRILHLPGLWKKRLRELGPKFDVCISCSNPVDFGRPGIHFIHMLTLDWRFSFTYWFPAINREVPMRARLAAMKEWVLDRLSGVRSVKQIVCDRREVVLPNSDFSRCVIDGYYGSKVHAAFYPPTLFKPIVAEQRNKYDIACLGRTNQEKRVHVIIDIVRRARAMTGYDFRLRIAGNIEETEYGALLRKAASETPWIIIEGQLSGNVKARYLSECTFAIHACKCEAFGISVSEYLKAGVVPIVPEEGGSSEVVGCPELTYNTEGEAVDILQRLANDKSFFNICREKCASRAMMFTAEAYMSRQTALLKELLK